MYRPSRPSSARSGTQARAAGTTSICPTVSSTTNPAAGSSPAVPVHPAGRAAATTAKPDAISSSPAVMERRRSSRSPAQRVTGSWANTTSTEDRANSQDSGAWEPAARCTSSGRARYSWL